MAKTVYDIIKKQNGEGFARVLREKGLLDIPDIASIVKYAGHSADDATAIFPYLWSLKEFEEDKSMPVGNPFQLLEQAGYHAFEVHNLDEQNSIRRFFRSSEELCTFRDPTRYQNNYIIHAIKHDVWRDPHAITPSNNPQRQDAYGTSVISIQIRKTGGFISIKNRYNHTVEHPDQTFNSNPDEIIPGLSAALKVYFNVDWKQTGVRLFDGFILLNNQILKTNFEINNCYIGDGFYITSTGEIIELDKRQFLQIDYFIWDAHDKILINPTRCDDNFVTIFNNFVRWKKVTISGKAPNQTILVNGIEIIKLQNQQIISLYMPSVTKIGNNFLQANKALQELSLPDLQSVGDSFLYHNRILPKLFLPDLQSVGNLFLPNNTALQKLNSISLESVGDYFLYRNTTINQVYLSNLQSVGSYFLAHDMALSELYLPNLQFVGDCFLYQNTDLKQILLPNLEHAGNFFLNQNTSLSELSLPKLQSVGCDCLIANKILKKLNLPNLEHVGSFFLAHSTSLSEISMPNLSIKNLMLNKHIKSLLSHKINNNPSTKEAFTSATSNLSNQSTNKPRKKTIKNPHQTGGFLTKKDVRDY